MRNSVLMAGLSFVIMAGGAAIAANERMVGMKHGPRHSFERRDADHDGVLTMTEMQGRHKGGMFPRMPIGCLVYMLKPRLCSNALNASVLSSMGCWSVVRPCCLSA